MAIAYSDRQEAASTRLPPAKPDLALCRNLPLLIPSPTISVLKKAGALLASSGSSAGSATNTDFSPEESGLAQSSGEHKGKQKPSDRTACVAAGTARIPVSEQSHRRRKMIRLFFKNRTAPSGYRLWSKSNHRRKEQKHNNKQKKEQTMKTKTNIKSGLGSISPNHNETLVRPQAKRSLKVKTNVKAGLACSQHNETLVRA